jgi:hypothetical protein
VNITGATIEYGGRTNAEGHPLGQVMLQAPTASTITGTTFTGGCASGSCPAPGSCPAGCKGVDGGTCVVACPADCLTGCAGCTEGCPTVLSGISLDCPSDTLVTRSANTYQGHTQCNGMWEWNCTNIAVCLPQ